MGQYRMQRLDAQLREEISSLLLRGEIKDPRVSNFLSINRVAVSSDLSYAKVYVSTFLSDAQLEKGVDGLNNAAGFIQSSIAKKLRIRKFPKFTFVIDKGMKEGFHMVQRLTELEKESEAVNADGADTAEHTANGSGNNIELEK
ncbi:MAG: 30S ribosome-binding factor RbfA [Treponema sp.]